MTPEIMNELGFTTPEEFAAWLDLQTLVPGQRARVEVPIGGDGEGTRETFATAIAPGVIETDDDGERRCLFRVLEVVA